MVFSYKQTNKTNRQTTTTTTTTITTSTTKTTTSTTTTTKIMMMMINATIPYKKIDNFDYLNPHTQILFDYS